MSLEIPATGGQSALLLPESSAVNLFDNPDTRVNTTEFPDGTTVSELQTWRLQHIVLTDSNNEVIPDALVGRYPYSERLARRAIEQFNQQHSDPS